MWARKIHDEWSKDYEGEQRKPKRDREETREEIRDIRESGTLLSPNGQLWVMQKLQTVDRLNAAYNQMMNQLGLKKPPS